MREFKPHDIPCPFCQGEGFDYDPRSERDPVEGNKMRPVVICLACKGRGGAHHESSLGAGFKAFNEVFDKTERDIALRQEAEVERLRKHQRSALSKLTDEEKAALGIT